MEAAERREEALRFDDPSVLTELFGGHDEHLRIVEKTWSVASAPSQKTPASASVVDGPAAAIRNEANGPRPLECVSV